MYCGNSVSICDTLIHWSLIRDANITCIGRSMSSATFQRVWISHNRLCHSRIRCFSDTHFPQSRTPWICSWIWPDPPVFSTRPLSIHTTKTPGTSELVQSLRNSHSYLPPLCRWRCCYRPRFNFQAPLNNRVCDEPDTANRPRRLVSRAHKSGSSRSGGDRCGWSETHDMRLPKPQSISSPVLANVPLRGLPCQVEERQRRPRISGQV